MKYRLGQNCKISMMSKIALDTKYLILFNVQILFVAAVCKCEGEKRKPKTSSVTEKNKPLRQNQAIIISNRIHTFKYGHGIFFLRNCEHTFLMWYVCVLVSGWVFLCVYVRLWTRTKACIPFSGPLSLSRRLPLFSERKQELPGRHFKGGQALL